MGKLSRYEKVGAVFSESLDSIQEIRNRGYTVNGNPQIVDGIRGKKALKFDGTGDYIDLGFPSALNLTGYINLTISMWIYPTSIETFDGFISNSQGGGLATVRLSYGIASSNRIEFDLGDGTTYSTIYSSVNALTLNKWQHIVVTVSSSGTTETVTHYVNGVLSNSGTMSRSVAASSASLKIGRNYNSSLYDFNGHISEVLMFPRALDSSEVKDLYLGTTFNYKDNLLYSYNFSEVPALQNLALRNQETVGTNASIAIANIVSGHNNKCLAILYDGSVDKTSFGDLGNIRSISMWVLPKTGTEQLFKLDTNVYVSISGNTISSTGLTSEAIYVNGVSSTTLTPNTWNHLIYVINATTDANSFEVAFDGTFYGNCAVSSLQLYSVALTNLQSRSIFEESR